MKLQSAIEYLSTYGWALIIIGIVAAALFEIISTTTSPIQECILPAGLSCPSFYISQNGMLQINLVQSTQYPIEVTALWCVNPDTLPSSLNPPAAVYMPIGSNHTFITQCYVNGTAYSGAIKSTYTGSLILNYTNGYTNFPNTVYGSIRVPVTR